MTDATTSEDPPISEAREFFQKSGMSGPAIGYGQPRQDRLQRIADDNAATKQVSFAAARAEALREKLAAIGETLDVLCGGAWLAGLVLGVVFCGAQAALLKIIEWRNIPPSIRDSLEPLVYPTVIAAIIMLIVCLIGGAIYLRSNLVLFGWFIFSLIPTTFGAAAASTLGAHIITGFVGDSCEYDRNYMIASCSSIGIELTMLLAAVFIIVLVGVSIGLAAAWWDALPTAAEPVTPFPLRPQAPPAIDNILD